MPARLSLALLYRIMEELGQLRDRAPQLIHADELGDLVEDTGEMANSDERLMYLKRHLDYLEEAGYLRIGFRTLGGLYGNLKLTVQGQMFVQPELAQFGQQAMLPQVVDCIEDRIQVLTYPQEEKDGMIYRLRDALAKQAPDMFVKLLVELLPKLISRAS